MWTAAACARVSVSDRERLRRVRGVFAACSWMPALSRPVISCHFASWRRVASRRVASGRVICARVRFGSFCRIFFLLASCHVMSSCRGVALRVVACSVMSCHVMSWHGMAWHGMAGQVGSGQVRWCRVVLCCVVSCHVMLCACCVLVSRRVMSCPVVSSDTCHLSLTWLPRVPHRKLHDSSPLCMATCALLQACHAKRML